MFDRSATAPHAGASLPARPLLPLARVLRSHPLRTPIVRQSGVPVYLVEADRALRIALAADLRAAGLETRPFAAADDLAEALPELAPGCVVADIELAFASPALREGGGEGEFLFPTLLLFGALSPDDAIAAVRLGAADLVRRSASLDELVAAVERSRPKVRALEVRLASRKAKAAIDTLTPREREVLGCMMKGLSSKEIARVLGVSPRTVEMHRARLHRRLSVNSIVDLLSLAWRARYAA